MSVLEFFTELSKKQQFGNKIEITDKQCYFTFEIHGMSYIYNNRSTNQIQKMSKKVKIVNSEAILQPKNIVV